MNEVIGKKSDWYNRYGKIYTILGIVLGLIYSYKIFDSDADFYMYIIVFIVIFIILMDGLYYLIIDHKAPKEMITYNCENETITVALIQLLSITKIEVKVKDIVRVQQRNYRYYRSFRSSSSGRIELVLKDQRILTAYNVYNVDDVKSKIDKIRILYKENNLI